MSGTIYYQRNREVILSRAKDHYENNKELLRERKQKLNIENNLKKIKIQKENMEETDIITCLKKRKKTKRISKKLSWG